MNESESLQIQNEIKSHYLFPVIELLISKCENATNTLEEEFFEIEDVFKLIHELKSKTADQDINNQNKEINQLVLDVIYMLRIHLLELSKLKKLIEKFRTKYTGTIKKTFTRESDLHSTSDSDDDSFLEDVYASNYPITASGMFFPGPFLPSLPIPPPQFPQQPSTDGNVQNKKLLQNNFINPSEKLFYEQQNNYLLHLAFLANTHHSLSQQPEPTTVIQNATTTVKSSTKKK